MEQDDVSVKLLAADDDREVRETMPRMIPWREPHAPVSLYIDSVRWLEAIT